MVKKIFIVIALFIATLNAQYSQYFKIVDISGKSKILSQGAIVKATQIGDLLFYRDNIIVDPNAYVIGYLKNRFLFKIKNNASMTFDMTFDRVGYNKIMLDNGELTILSPINYSIDNIVVVTPNANIKVAGSAIISYDGSSTIIKYLHGYGSVNDTSIEQFIEVTISSSGDFSTNSMIMNSNLRRDINEIINIPYMREVSSIDIYRSISQLPDNTTFNIQQSIIE